MDAVNRLKENEINYFLLKNYFNKEIKTFKENINLKKEYISLDYDGVNYKYVFTKYLIILRFFFNYVLNKDFEDFKKEIKENNFIELSKTLHGFHLIINIKTNYYLSLLIKLMFRDDEKRIKLDLYRMFYYEKRGYDKIFDFKIYKNKNKIVKSKKIKFKLNNDEIKNLYDCFFINDDLKKAIKILKKNYFLEELKNENFKR